MYACDASASLLPLLESHDSTQRLPPGVLPAFSPAASDVSVFELCFWSSFGSSKTASRYNSVMCCLPNALIRRGTLQCVRPYNLIYSSLARVPLQYRQQLPLPPAQDPATIASAASSSAEKQERGGTDPAAAKNYRPQIIAATATMTKSLVKTLTESFPVWKSPEVGVGARQNVGSSSEGRSLCALTRLHAGHSWLLSFGFITGHPAGDDDQCASLPGQHQARVCAHPGARRFEEEYGPSSPLSVAYSRMNCASDSLVLPRFCCRARSLQMCLKPRMMSIVLCLTYLFLFAPRAHTQMRCSTFSRRAGARPRPWCSATMWRAQSGRPPCSARTASRISSCIQGCWQRYVRYVAGSDSLCVEHSLSVVG